MNCLHCYRIGISLLCLLVGWTGFVQAQTLSVGENAVAASGGCAITRDMAEDSPWAGYFERVADRVAAVLTPETRDTILQLKYETSDEEHIPGIAYYRAVLEGGVRNCAEFMAWLQEHPVDGIVAWMP